MYHETLFAQVYIIFWKKNQEGKEGIEEGKKGQKREEGWQVIYSVDGYSEIKKKKPNNWQE